MWRRIAEMIFGSSAESSYKQPPSDAMDRHATPSESDGARKPWRTVGQTEQRLRDRNRESWVTSTKGWSEMLGRFSSK